MAFDSTDPLFSVAGKVALITAAGSGMGRAATLLFAERGAHVIAVDVIADAVKEVVEEVVAAGGSAEAHTVDLTDIGQVETFIETILETHEVLDVLYNHAGLRGAVGMAYDAEDVLSTTTINLLTPMLLTKQLLPLLRRSESASLIYTASISGLGSSPHLMTYGATKAGVINYMKSIAVQLGPEGIRANGIAPGATRTAGMVRNNSEEVRTRIAEQIPLRRMGEPEEDAAVALFLASDASRYVTGVLIPVDGGLTA
ncbi:MAG: SDR family NAD(P)-dependent oxidoreductase [Nocardioides sp.]|uniref:SDR family NAD(P)-dependent oxidoreductase n=1 Tax=Nocardioides sp. TaxID=35761 RepID=UPI0039E46C81